MPWVQGDGGAYWKDDEPLSDQQFITTYASDEFGNYFPQVVQNPNWDWKKNDPEGYAAEEARAATMRPRNNFLDKIGRTFENNVTQRLEPFVEGAAQKFNSAASKYALPAIGAALTAGVGSEFLLPALQGAGGTTAAGAGAGAGGVTGLGELGINTALAAGTPGAIAAPSNWLANAAGAITGASGGGMSNFLGPALGAAAQVGGAVMADRQISRAADTAAASADKQLAFQQQQYNDSRADQQPWLDAGKAALGKLTPLMDYKKFSMEDFMKDPGYNFRMAEGEQAINRSAAAGAGLQSGKALKDAARFGQGLASQEFGNAFDRYQTEYGASIKVPAMVAGFGQNATNNLQSARTNLGNTSGTIMANAGNTQANAQIARGSTYANTANELAQMLTRYGRA